MGNAQTVPVGGRLAIRSYCCIPKDRRKSKEGTCPDLLYSLLEELKGASEIHIAAYLFNNPVLFEFLVGLCRKGTKVYVTSIPLSGYNNTRKKVIDYENKISAREKAREIYSRASETKNLALKIFPHLYVWYGALYNDGGASYSFHVKAIYARFKSGTSRCILLSGNFMFTDPAHSDSLVVFEEMPEYERAFAIFFNDLERFAIPIKRFRKHFKTYKDEFLYSFGDLQLSLRRRNFRHCFFTSPFYVYDDVGSNHYARERIIEVIERAKTRIWICSQHFHDVIPFDKSPKTLVGALLDKSRSAPNTQIRLLKQVPHSSLSDKRRAAITETLFQYVLKAEQRYNNLVHDKFILADNTLIISSANYTPTQFAHGKVTMKFKSRHRTIKKQDYFSEVNAFAVIPNCPKNALKQYEQHFETLWNDATQLKISP